MKWHRFLSEYGSIRVVNFTCEDEHKWYAYKEYVTRQCLFVIVTMIMGIAYFRSHFKNKSRLYKRHRPNTHHRMSPQSIETKRFKSYSDEFQLEYLHPYFTWTFCFCL